MAHGFRTSHLPHTTEAGGPFGALMGCCPARSPVMRQSISGRFQRQAEFLRRQFLQGGGLPLADVLSADLVGRALAAIGTTWYDRVYTPLVTLWLFLGQALGPDPSCRAAVARLNADRASRGLLPCSARTGAYC